MALQVEQIFVSGFDENFSYVVYSVDTQEAFIVDPSGNFELVLERIAALQLNVAGILLTHTHADHMDALNSAIKQFPVPIFVHDAGISVVGAEGVQSMIDADEIELGNDLITVVHTPGHSEDSVCFLFTIGDEQPVLISGDTLFIDGCGKTDDQMVFDLYNSIQFLKRLPPETVVLPGHNYGPVATDTLTNQLLTNRFLHPNNFDTFCIERLGYAVDT
jgi:glyoxylase-like metal-dependent hydrolase (beta-lactamase superfamily II)